MAATDRFPALWVLPGAISAVIWMWLFHVSWGLLNASVVLAVIPTVVLVAFVWRFVVEGLLAGGVEP